MAYSPDKRPKTLGQKAKKFFRRLTLTAAFAAAVGGTGYYHYGTQEDIQATVTSVEVNPSSNPGKPPEMIIHTDKGTFVNHPTVMFLKDGAQTMEVAQVAQPGKLINLRVYGYNPAIRGQTRDDFHFYRNIVTAWPVLNLVAPPAPEGPAPVAQPDANARWPLYKPAPLNVTPDPVLLSARPADEQQAPEASASNSNLSEIASKTPQLAHDLAIMAQLPLTGQGIYVMLKDPAYGITSTLFPVAPGEGSRSTYVNKHARIARGSGTTTAFHEYFHAWQAMNGASGTYSLTMRDAVISEMMQEATAVAYEMAARREALNHGLLFTPAAEYTEQVPGGTIRHYVVSAATREANVNVFNAAYDKAFLDYASADAQTRERKALEAGGKAVVRHLLDNKDQSWSNTYTSLTLENINNNSEHLRETGASANYGAKRDGVYTRIGSVSPFLSFVPEEFLGANAGQGIDNVFKGLGFSITPSQAREQDNNATQQSRSPSVPRAPRPG